MHGADCEGEKSVLRVHERTLTAKEAQRVAAFSEVSVGGEREGEVTKARRDV